MFAHLFHSSLQQADLMMSVHIHIYMLVFLPPLHPCTHKGPQHLGAAYSASSLLCGGATTSRLQCSLVIQGLRLLREPPPASVTSTKELCIASAVPQTSA